MAAVAQQLVQKQGSRGGGEGAAGQLGPWLCNWWNGASREPGKSFPRQLKKKKNFFSPTDNRRDRKRLFRLREKQEPTGMWSSYSDINRASGRQQPSAVPAGGVVRGWA